MAEAPPPGFVPLDQVPPPGFVPLGTAAAEKPSLWQSLMHGIGAPVAQEQKPAAGGLWDKLLDAVPNLSKMTGLPSAVEQHEKSQGTIGDPYLWGLGTGNIGRLGAGAGAQVPFAKALQKKLPAAERLADFKGAGVTPNVPAVGQGRNIGTAAHIARLAPFSPVQERITQNLQEASTAAEQRASQYGGAIRGTADEIKQQAGSVAQNEMKRFATVTAPAEAEKEFGRFYALMHGAPPQPMTSTLNVLQRLRGTYPNAPELQGLFSNPKLTRIWQALEPRKETIPGKTSAVLGPSGQPIITAPPRTVERGGVLSMPEIRQLRSSFGELLSSPAFGPDSIPIGEVKRLYGGLTGDMMAAARARGPQAVASLQNAVTGYGVRMRIIERMKGLADPNTPAMATFNAIEQMARGTGRGDPLRLAAIKREMSTESWNDFAAAMIRKLGKLNPGEPVIGGLPDFSINNFGTNWHRLSEPAKDSLFGENTAGSPRAGMEQLVRVTDSLKAVARLGNVPRSGEYMLVGSFLEAFLSGGVPWTTIGIASAGYGLGKALMSPKVAQMLYDMPKLAAGAQTPEAARALALALTRSAIAGVADKPDDSEQKQGVEPGVHRERIRITGP